MFHLRVRLASARAPAASARTWSIPLAGNNGFFRRALSISNAVPLRVKNLVSGTTTFTAPARETVHYVTFIAAPTVEFIRHDKGGLFTGIENPYFKADLSEQGVALSFEPGPDPESRRGLYQRAAVHGGLQEVRGDDRGQRPRISLQRQRFRLQAPRPQ